MSASRTNNNQRSSRRIRGKSCPAGVRFQFNNFKKNGGNRSESQHEKHDICLAKVSNIVLHERRGSLPFAELPKAEEKTSYSEDAGHLANYSIHAGGIHNRFRSKLEGNINIFHSPTNTSHQHKNSNKSDAKIAGSVCCALSSSFPVINHILEKTAEPISNYEHSGTPNAEFDKHSIDDSAASKSSKHLNIAKDGREQGMSSFDEMENNASYVSPARQFNAEAFGVNIVKVSDHNDNLLVLSDDENNKQDTEYEEYDTAHKGADCDVFIETELLADNNSTVCCEDVEKATTELAMSKKKQESELSDLIHLNEEMQSMWSEKEAEVREMLERFSAYRMAVEADSKEKEELFTEEIIKRENIIKELEFEKSSLQQQLSTKDATTAKLIKDAQHLERTRLKQITEIDELVAELAEHVPREDSKLKTKCERISERVQAAFEDLKDSKVMKCTTEKHSDFVGDKVNGFEESSIINSHDEYRLFVENDKKRNSMGLMGDKQSSVNGQLEVQQNGNQTESFQSDHKQTVSLGKNERCEETGFGNEEVYSALHETFGDSFPVGQVEEDLANLVKRLEENEVDINELENDGGGIPRVIFVKLLADQWERCQVMCKEKDDEIQHLIKKHKQDMKNLHDLLEEQERSEVKNNENLANLQVEVDNLQRRNKFLESELEVVKEEGEEEVCVLRESFQKDLFAELKRQSVSFLSSEEASRNQLAEMEEKNEELQLVNEDLRQQIAEHCSEIKSWVSGILVLSEEEYNEEFHTISDVLAKLQKIILENKSLIEQLQSQIREENIEEDYPEAEDVLSHSWGGHTWNSETSQKDLCSHCKQKKWRRALMGSFEMLDADRGGMEVKQEEINTFIAKIDINEGRYRKRQSLRDSLELAEAQDELRARLGEEAWNSLATLGEDSLEGVRSLTESGEGITVSDESDSEDLGQSTGEDTENEHDDFPLLIVDEEEGRNVDESKSEVDGSDPVVHEVQDEGEATNLAEKVAIGMNGSVAYVDDMVEERVDKVKESGDSEEGLERLDKGRSKKQHKAKKERRESGTVYITSDKENMVENTKEKEENKESVLPVKTNMVDGDDDGCDMVQVVNLYRSLIDYSPTPFKEDDYGTEADKYFIGQRDGDNGVDECDNYVDEFDNHVDNNVRDDDDVDDDVDEDDDDDDGYVDNDDGAHENNDGGGSDCDGYHDDDDDDDDDDDENDDDDDDDDSVDVTDHSSDEGDDGVHYDRNDTVESTPQSYPQICLEEDCNENIHELSKNEIAHGISETESMGRGQNSDGKDEAYDTSVIATDGSVFDIKESETTEGNLLMKDLCANQDGAAHPALTSENSETPVKQTLDILKENTVCAGFCTSCSDVLMKSSERYEKTIEKLLELKSERENGEQSQLLQELKEAKVDVKRYQEQCEELQKVCDDYQKRMHEYSENMRNKNNELRKLQLTSNILKTEVEWLRQALEISKDYCTVELHTAW